MRPGPGLVVMALAFISGARRASTSSSSSGSSSSSLLLTTTGGTTTDSTTETGTRATTIPPAITTTTATLSATAATLPSTYDSASGSSESFNFNAGGGFTFLLPTFHDGSPGDGGRPSSSDTADHSNSHHTHSHSHTNTPIHSYAHHADDRPPLNFDFYRRPTLHAPNDDDDDESLLASSTRRARSVDEATRQAGGQDIDGRGTGGGGSGSSSGGGTESAAVVPESSEATLISENDDVEPDTEQEQEQEREREEDNSGLPVQYASSRALEEDTDTEADADVVADEDIFALVAEDDLLSEESFDRLIKLSEDAETAAAEEEDYNLSLTQPQQQPQSDQKLEQPELEPEPEPEPESQQQDESRLVDESVLHAQHNEQHAEEESISISNNNKRETGEERSRGNDAYASHLIAIAQRDGGTLAAAVATPTTTNPATTTTATTASKPAVDLKKSILGTATAITRLNPWISACDLAQPGITGTDLQGQCSAGTLPMAWVDEGPGPPICPRSCAEQQPTDSSPSSSASSSHAADNKVKYFRNANTINYKSRLSHSSSSSSSNNNNKAMSRMRREREWQLEGANDAATEMAATTTEREQELELDMEEELEASTLAATSSSSNVDELDEQSMPTLLYSHLQTHEQLSANEQQQQQQQQQQPQQQQQQCLDYLGDAAETSPQHLCGLRSPGQLLARLRSLRLRHCCERSVFSALHTLALNATLTDRNECVRLLSDLLEVDALSNRITCELAEILFRFDCRQVYSLINQCDDCKEAYRRWVCSTLVPYFAEPQDVDAAPPPPTTTKPKTQQQTTTPADDLANRGPMAAGVKSKRAARSAGVQGAAVVVVGVGVGGSDGINGIKHKSQKLISNNNKSNNGNNMNERQINQQHDEDIEPQHKATATATATVESERDNDESERESESVAQAFYNVVGIGQHQSQAQKRQQPQPQPQTAPQSQLQLQPQSQDSKRKDNNSRAAKAGQQQFNNFISTANNADPSAADPVISKLQKRSTRKAEFRKRRRIRPCLSVCQTVEQKCPYLLPADRAPALPTQYAGEPTFVCLDQNIPETGEQLKKSSYGPNDCCYSYCNGPTAGICTICQDFAMPTSTTANANSNSNSSSNASGHRVHNITLTMSSPAGEHARAASVSVALRNVSGAEKMAGGELLERLPYYARHESIYYYDDDDDEGSVMPEVALSDGCAAVPSVSSRCEIPYYASGVAPSPPTQLLVWLSALLGLLSSCGAARQRCARSRSSSSATGRVDCAASCHELLASSSMSSGERARERERERGDSPRRCRDGSVKGNGSARSFTASLQAWAWAWAWAWASPTNWAWSCLGAWLWVWVWVWPVNTYKVMCRKVRYFRGGSRSKLKIERIRDGDGEGEGEMRSRDSRIINYRDLQQLIRIKCSDRNRNARNYRYFYYYNYNINDWWRRWKWFVKGTIAIGAL
ncbi:uncharacterized protein LOC117568376 [Drosophila albomicans]|uniref:Uncharacterized protein LOC117568376 n=1 Tax=Drosophila albomicans TaxID=7291 RepID=A0A6P8WRD4_DROAB|nr:uncharacterized protein LOC117568376 [Drosophila albomicans]XP_051859823.1 uncharacterized protein LOC117568376 [Drosophila albomicans]XP_051859824.1 uncharacterized protein LOC117568376 [Drosophila albomicans]